jgi:hypothetical protein
LGGIAYAADLDLEVNTGITYGSNVIRAATAPEDDIYITMAPRIALKLPFNKLYFSSSLRPALEQHMSQTDENLQELVFSGLARYDPSDYMSFGLHDELAVSGRLKSAEKYTDVTRYREFIDNKLYSSFRYEWKEGILAASLRYGNTIRDYAHTEKDDWIAHTGELQFEYSFGHKTSTQLGFGLIRKVYKADIYYIEVPMAASLKRKLSNKLDSRFSLGLENRGYNEAYKSRNLDKLAAILEIEGRLTSKTTSKLRLHYKTYDSDFATGYVFVSKAADIRLVLNLRHKAQLILEGFYSRNDYIRLKRRDNFFQGYTQIRHRYTERGDVVFAYGYEKRTSSVFGGGYQQHVIDLYYISLF